MTRPTRLSRILKWGVALPALCLCLCRVVYVDYVNTSGLVTLRTLELTESDVSGWTPKPEVPFTVYVGDELFGPIDGGAPMYLDLGCIETGIQGLKGPSSYALNVMVMDFGTVTNAEAMFRDRKTAATDAKKVPSFTEDMAIYDNSVIGGVTGYAFALNFYFELQFTGFMDKKQAIQALDLFLKIYLAKMK